MKLEKNKVIVQIGTYNGCDEFNCIVRNMKPSLLILVEPNKELNAEILSNYKGVENVFIENVAITEVTQGLVSLVHPANKERKNGQYYNECFSLLPMDDWGTDFKSITVYSLSFMDLCKKYNITNIHFLQIDTEGMDCTIIKSIDFKKIHIDILKYENWSFPEDCFTRHGDKKKGMGINGMNQVKNLLEYLGYTLDNGKQDIIAVKNGK